MDTLTPVERSAGAPPDAPPASPPRRRRPWLVAVSVFGAIVIVAVLAGAVWAANYEPLGTDNTLIGVRPVRAVVDQLDATSPDGLSFTEFRLRIQQGDIFRYRFDLHNDGVLPATITSVGRAPGDNVNFDVVRVRVGPAVKPLTFELPYTVDPGEYVGVEVSEWLATCLNASMSVGFGVLPVTYETLGVFRHDVSIVMPMTITLLGRPQERCDG